ncbi:NAD-dependent epimerase/dehydratase [Caballeronia catudaia]|uniref:NAD-dependent epimerase/dehydratase n=1 Tax=Caballeronia catudaia TaxID=1777136 RepID=A0A158DTU7_9BURK|nr:NAD-dependent epimerase/dehydratase [Caballeronia catudaia]
MNADVFRWKWLWPRIAGYFGVPAEDFDGTMRPLGQQIADAAPLSKSIARRHGLIESDVNQLASWWHTDADLGRPAEVVTDMSKSRKAGFLEYQSTEESFTDLFDRLRAQRIIPAG